MFLSTCRLDWNFTIVIFHLCPPSIRVWSKFFQLRGSLPPPSKSELCWKLMRSFRARASKPWWFNHQRDVNCQPLLISLLSPIPPPWQGKQPHPEFIWSSSSLKPRSRTSWSSWSSPLATKTKIILIILIISVVKQDEEEDGRFTFPRAFAVVTKSSKYRIWIQSKGHFNGDNSSTSQRHGIQIKWTYLWKSQFRLHRSKLQGLIGQDNARTENKSKFQ